VLAVTSEYHPKFLDLGITRIDGRDKHFLKYRFSKAGFVTIPDHAKWKYLVSADGCVAQTRLVKVGTFDAQGGGTGGGGGGKASSWEHAGNMTVWSLYSSCPNCCMCVVC
jgi:hypothetical protein